MAKCQHSTLFYRKCRLSIKYFWALDNITPEEYVKKHLKKPEIFNLHGTAFWVRLNGKKEIRLRVKDVSW